MRKRKRKN